MDHGTGIHGIRVMGGRLSLVGMVLSSVALVPPLEPAKGVSRSLWVSLVFGWSKDAFKALLFEPDLLISLCGVGPFFKVFGVLLVQACVSQRCGKSLSEEAQEFWFIDIMASAMGQLGESSDVHINIPILHPQLPEVFVGFLVFSIVDEGLFELPFHNVPFAHAPREESRVAVDFVEPVILLLDPPLGIGSSEQCHEVIALLEWILCNVRISVDVHEVFELGQEGHSLALVPVELVRDNSFKSFGFGIVRVIVEVCNAKGVVLYSVGRSSSSLSLLRF